MRTAKGRGRRQTSGAVGAAGGILVIVESGTLGPLRLTVTLTPRAVLNAQKTAYPRTSAERQPPSTGPY